MVRRVDDAGECLAAACASCFRSRKSTGMIGKVCRRSGRSRSRRRRDDLRPCFRDAGSAGPSRRSSRRRRGSFQTIRGSCGVFAALDSATRVASCRSRASDPRTRRSSGPVTVPRLHRRAPEATPRRAREPSRRRWFFRPSVRSGRRPGMDMPGRARPSRATTRTCPGGPASSDGRPARPGRSGELFAHAPLRGSWRSSDDVDADGGLEVRAELAGQAVWPPGRRPARKSPVETRRVRAERAADFPARGAGAEREGRGAGPLGAPATLVSSATCP